MNTNQPNHSYPWLMLISRSALFLLFQLLIALILALAGAPAAFEESARWWTFVAILTNLVSVYLLVRVFKAEGKRYEEAVGFSRSTITTDLFWFVLSLLVAAPIGALPMNPLGELLFGDATVPVKMMFRPIPIWAFMLSFLFPLTIALAELPTYFGYSMPRLFRQGDIQTRPWLAWLIASFFLGAQHMFLPFIPDGRFLLWRLLMYMPFALFIGLVLKLRPSLLPYYMIMHALIDASAVLAYLAV